jgi:hypothetical protein
MVFETAKDHLPSEESISEEEDLEDSGSKGDEIMKQTEHNSNRYVIDPSEMGELSA